MKLSIAAAAVGVLLAVLSGGCPAKPAPSPNVADKGAPPKTPAEVFSPEAVDKAVERGAKWLWSKQKADGSWPPYDKGESVFYPAGPTALAARALLESGVNPQAPRMAKALDWLAKQKITKTYTLALRANVWAVANRTTDGKYRKLLQRDVVQFWRSTSNGAYSYESKGRPPSKGKVAPWWDNSNTAYGLMGIGAGARDRLEVPSMYWQVSLEHWLRSQREDGGWSYAPRHSGGSTPTMTLGGIASLCTCFENMYLDKYVRCERPGQFPPLKNALDWLGKHIDKAMEKPDGYFLCALARAGLLTGYKHFGEVDWYCRGASHLLRTQQKDGCWSGRFGAPVETAFAVMFLSEGRRPVVLNKLQFPGDWNNRPRALAALTQWLSRLGGRTVRWQVVNVSAPVAVWHDAPVLCICGALAPRLTAADIDKLRTFVLQGGTIFSVTECDGQGFSAGIRQVYARMFPNYQLVPAGRAHPIHNREVLFTLAGRPKFHIMSNGVRPLIIHTDEDLALSWQLRRTATQRRAFEAAANAIVYATGQWPHRRPRGSSHWPGPYKGKFDRPVKLARLRHGGDHDPEPLAYKRLALLMGHRTRTKLEVLGPIRIAALAGSGAKVATLTGTGPLKLSAADRKALKQFVAAGGTLVIDAAGGSRPFADSARKMLGEMYGPAGLVVLGPDSPIYKLKGYEIKRRRYRPRARARMGDDGPPPIRAVIVGGRAGVIFSRADITAGLVGFTSFTVDGYEPQSAYELMRNILMLAPKR